MRKYSWKYLKKILLKELWKNSDKNYEGTYEKISKNKMRLDWNKEDEKGDLEKIIKRTMRKMREIKEKWRKSGRRKKDKRKKKII